jgi:hypothetical protein
VQLFRQNKLFSLCFTATASIILAYIFGNQGIEAFFAIYIATGILFSIYLGLILRSLFATRYWLIVKLLGTIILLFVWAIFVTAILMLVFEPNINPKIVIPSLNWWIISPSALAFVVQVPLKHSGKLQLELSKLVGRAVATLLTIVLMFVAFIVFAGMESHFRTLALVVAVQLQYIANYIAVETSYFQNVHAFIEGQLARRSMQADGRLAITSYALLMGAPFLIPLIFIIIMSKV